MSITKGNVDSTLLAQVVACRDLVDDYSKRLDAASAEYSKSGKTVFPDLTRAEDEDITQQCKSVLRQMTSVLPDAMARWDSIEYPIGQYKQMVERMQDMWIRRRNLMRTCVTTLRTKLELEAAPNRLVTESRGTRIKGNRVLIIHGHDERNMLALKDLLQSKLHLPEPVIMAQQMVPGASLPEKFERLAASVRFAVALLTPDDVGRASSDAELAPRPRQNTLVEIGWFWGRLGRERILLLVKEELEIPSDLQGVEYYRFRSKVEDLSEKIRDFFEAHREVEDE